MHINIDLIELSRHGTPHILVCPPSGDANGVRLPWAATALYFTLNKLSSKGLVSEGDDTCVNPRILFQAILAPHPFKKRKIEYIYKSIIKIYIFQKTG
jgi:hypothetical protein